MSHSHAGQMGEHALTGSLQCQRRWWTLHFVCTSIPLLFLDWAHVKTSICWIFVLILACKSILRPHPQLQVFIESSSLLSQISAKMLGMIQLLQPSAIQSASRETNELRPYSYLVHRSQFSAQFHIPSTISHLLLSMLFSSLPWWQI